MKRIVNIFIIFLLLFISEDVMAAVKNSDWCSENKKHYVISYDTKYVGDGDIDKESVELGYVKGHENDRNYRIESYSTDMWCEKGEDSFIKTCPSSSLLKLFFAGENSLENLKSKKLIVTEFNLSKKKFDIKIDKSLSSKYYIRKTPTDSEDNSIYSRNLNYYYKDHYPDNQFLGNSNVFTAEPGEFVILEFYEKGDDGCNGAFIISHFYEMESSANILINNPALTDPNSSIYQMCDKYVRKNPNYSNDAISLTIKKTVVPICYSKDTEDKDEANKITLTEYNKINVNDIINSTSRLDKLLIQDNSSSVDNTIGYKPNNIFVNSTYSCSSGNGKLKCDNETSYPPHRYEAYSNSDFIVYCTDTYKFKGGKPRLTYAGGGFEYGSDVDYSLIRTCNIDFYGNPAVLPTQCTGIECRVTSNYDNKDYPDKFAGPNENFDGCVNMCDGGKYTQSCINSCYNKVYGDDTKRSNSLDKMSNLLNNEKKGSINKLLDYDNKNYVTTKVVKTEVLPNGVPVYVPDGFTITNIRWHEWNDGKSYGYMYDLVDPNNNKVGSSAASSNYCALPNHNGYQYWNCRDIPDGCVWNAVQVYQNRVNQIIANYEAAVNSMLSMLTLTAGQVDLTIVDSYLKNDNDKFYSFSINNYSTDLKLKLDLYYPKVDKDPEAVSVSIGQYDEKVKEITMSASIGVNNISIDANSYVGKEYGNVAYNNGNRTFTINKSGGSYGINPLNSFNKNDYYFGNANNGNAQYFTSLFSSNKNVRVNSNGDVNLNLGCYNIELGVSGLGTENMNYGFSNSCYYGVYNNYVLMPDPGTNPDSDSDSDSGSGSDPNCDDNGNCPGYGPGEKVGEIRYIFRPIELTDVFPDREPRWNWTNSASLNLNGNDPYLGYNVNPLKATSHIQGSGNNILTDSNELDYEIIIDRRGIANIKKFNIDMGSYTNFDLNCVNRGATLCKSNFLDNAMYIRNYKRTRVNATIGTNND